MSVRVTGPNVNSGIVSPTASARGPTGRSIVVVTSGLAFDEHVALADGHRVVLIDVLGLERDERHAPAPLALASPDVRDAPRGGQLVADVHWLEVLPLRLTVQQSPDIHAE